MILKFKDFINEGARIALINPGTEKIIKTVLYNGLNKDADKEVELLNGKLSNNLKLKGYYWKIINYENF